MPQTFTYANMTEANNVIVQLPPEARIPTSGMRLETLSDDTVLMTVPDEFADEVTNASPVTPGTAALNAYSANKRWQAEGSGIVVNGRPIRTTIDSQSKIADLNTAYVNGTLTGTVSFKCADNTFFNADQAAVHDIYSAIIAHVQSCYECEEGANAAIAAGTVTQYAQVDPYFADI